MQDRHLFEYAVIRLVPRVEREEFLNVGVVLYCKGLKFLKAKCFVDETRLSLFSPETNIDDIKIHLKAFSDISGGHANGGPIALLDLASRFRWLTATRSTIIQTSKVHPGFCIDADLTLDKLFEQMVQTLSSSN